MSKPLVINVNESVETLKKYIRSAETDTKKKRLKILRLMDKIQASRVYN
jgi:aromatic ring hydroxylase